MAITLDAATEERIQRQLDRGAFPGPTELPGAPFIARPLAR
jgi:hypothetical protein